jgi:hypothetical protein
LERARRKNSEKAGDLAKRRLHTAGRQTIENGSSIPQLQLTIAIAVVTKLKGEVDQLLAAYTNVTSP